MPPEASHTHTHKIKGLCSLFKRTKESSFGLKKKKTSLLAKNLDRQEIIFNKQSQGSIYRTILKILYSAFQSRRFSRCSHNFSSRIVDEQRWKTSVDFIIILVDVITGPSDATCKIHLRLGSTVTKANLILGIFLPSLLLYLSYQDCPFGAFFRGRTNSLGTSWTSLHLRLLLGVKNPSYFCQLNLNLICILMHNVGKAPKMSYFEFWRESLKCKQTAVKILKML